MDRERSRSFRPSRLAHLSFVSSLVISLAACGGATITLGPDDAGGGDDAGRSADAGADGVCTNAGPLTCTNGCSSSANCPGAQICLQIADPELQGVTSSCRDNPCGTQPLSCTCAGSLCTGTGGFCSVTGGGITCTAGG